MYRRVILCGVGLTCALTLDAQERQQTPQRATQPRASDRLDRQNDAIAPQVIEQLQLPVAESSAETIRARPDVEREVVSRETAAAAQDRAASTAPGVMVDLEAVRARAGIVQDIRVFGAREEVTPATDERALVLRRGDLLAVRRPDTAEPGRGSIATPVPTDPAAAAPGGSGAESVTASPTILYTLDDAGRVRELGLVHRSAGLHWQPDQGRFVGELLVGVLDREDPRASGPLGAMVPIQLLAAPGTLAESDLSVDSIGVPFRRVAVEVAVPEDPFSIAFVSQIDPDLPPAALEVVRPRLLLLAPDVVQGLGVGEASVTVSALDASLRPGQAITLELDNGWLEDRTVVVGETGTASTRIRSDWLGRGTLSVAAPAMFVAAPKEIQYTAPLRFIVATLVGGMLGSLVLVSRLKRAEPPGHRSYAMDWIVGVIIGSAATTMAYAGMKLPEWIPVPATLVGEAAPFALSFICAAAGTGLIRSIVGVGQKSD